MVIDPGTAAGAVSAIDSALKLFSSVRENWKKVTEAEFRGLMADLSMELSQVKVEVANLRIENLRLREENSRLEARLIPGKEKPTVKFGCYKFEGDERLYCPGCYETQGKKHITNRKSTRERVCTVCSRTMYP